MAVEIRQAKVDEAPLIVPAYEWLFSPPGYTPEGWNPPRAERALKEAIESDDSAVLIAEDGGELLGLCTAYLELNSVRFGQMHLPLSVRIMPGSSLHCLTGGCSILRQAPFFRSVPFGQMHFPPSVRIMPGNSVHSRTGGGGV